MIAPSPAAQVSQTCSRLATELIFTLSGGGNFGIAATAGGSRGGGYIIAVAQFQYCATAFAFISDRRCAETGEKYLAIQLDEPFNLGLTCLSPEPVSWAKTKLTKLELVLATLRGLRLPFILVDLSLRPADSALNFLGFLVQRLWYSVP